MGRAVVLWVAVGMAAMGQDAWTLACGGVVAQNVQFPAGNPLGTVSARFALDQNGGVVDVRTTGASVLAKAVADVIAATAFPAVCRGRKVAVDATFSIPGDLGKGLTGRRFIQLNRESVELRSDGGRENSGGVASRNLLTAIGGLAPVTVCELLADPARFDGKAVLLLGRITGTSEGQWVSEDRCERELRSGSYVWKNMVSLRHTPLSAAPVAGLVVVDPEVLAAKLAALRERTQLRFQDQLVAYTDGRSARRMQVREDWILVYGVVRTRVVLRPPGSLPQLDRDFGNGFGHLNGAPAEIESRGGLQYLIAEP